jgi:hypothetical protein
MDSFRPNQGPLDLSIEANKTAFVLGEPVYVTAKLRNQASEPIALRREEEYLMLYLSSDGIQFQLIEEGIVAFHLSDFGARNELLRPGDEWEFKAVVHHTHLTDSRLVINQPGGYYLGAEFGGYTLGDNPHGWPNYLKSSNIIKISFEKPKGVDAQILEMLRGKDGTFKDYGYLVRGVLGRNDELIEKLYDIVQNYPRSVYTLIIRQALVGFFERWMKVINEPGLSVKEKQMYESLRPQH